MYKNITLYLISLQQHLFRVFAFPNFSRNFCTGSFPVIVRGTGTFAIPHYNNMTTIDAFSIIKTIMAAVEAHNFEDTRAIKALIQAFFDSINTADTKGLKSHFLPAANLTIIRQDPPRPADSAADGDAPAGSQDAYAPGLGEQTGCDSEGGPVPKSQSFENHVRIHGTYIWKSSLASILRTASGKLRTRLFRRYGFSANTSRSCAVYTLFVSS